MTRPLFRQPNGAARSVRAIYCVYSFSITASYATTGPPNPQPPPRPPVRNRPSSTAIRENPPVSERVIYSFFITPHVGFPVSRTVPSPIASPRAPHPFATPVQDVGIDHRGPHILVPEKLLDSADVIPGLEQMRGKRVPQRVAGRSLGEASPAGGVMDGFL